MRSQNLIVNTYEDKKLTKLAAEQGLGKVSLAKFSNGESRYVVDAAGLGLIEIGADEKSVPKRLVELGAYLQGGGVMTQSDAAREIGVNRQALQNHMGHDDPQMDILIVYRPERLLPAAEVKRLKKQGLPNRGVGGRPKRWSI